MSEETNEIKEIQENGIYYYIIPSGYPLFKATKNYDIASGGLFLDPNGIYFFGVKNDNPEYIESYEKEYGIIFEFIVDQPYKLLALDNKNTQTKIYESAPENIQIILERNYGYKNGLRNSDYEPDRILAEYICKEGYNGYAIKNMETDFGGSFHPEFMFCDIKGINYVKKVTSDERVNEILESEKQKATSRKLKDSRKKNKRFYLEDYDNEYRGDVNNYQDDHAETLFKPKSLVFEGGVKRNTMRKKRKSIKKRKTMKKSRKMHHYKNKKRSMKA